MDIEKYKGYEIKKVNDEYEVDGDSFYFANYISLVSIKKEIDKYLNGEFEWDK